MGKGEGGGKREREVGEEGVMGEGKGGRRGRGGGKGRGRWERRGEVGGGGGRGRWERRKRGKEGGEEGENRGWEVTQLLGTASISLIPRHGGELGTRLS